MNVFHEFHPRGKFERSLNASFIAFILKKAGAAFIKSNLKFYPTS